MNVLITGGVGFLGLHLATYFHKKKHHLTLVDINSFDKAEYPRDCKMILVDVRDKEKMKKLMRGIDVVIHTAAALPLSRPETIMDVNVMGTKSILEAAKANNIKRVIHISSTAVYGVPKKHPVYEDDPLIGVGPYGESKIKAENYCLNAMAKGQNVTIIRPKTFLGTRRLGVFEILFDWIHDGKKIPVIGNGNNRYQLLDVDDLVEAIYLISSKNLKKYNDIYNIGAIEFSTVKNDLGALFKFAGSHSKLLPTPAGPVKRALWFFEKIRLSPLYQWVYDTADKDSFVSIDKLKKALNWKPKYSNSQALIKAYGWYLSNYDEIKTRSTGITHTVGWKQGILGIVKKFL